MSLGSHLLTNTVGRKNPAATEKPILILLDAHSAFIERLLTRHGYAIAAAESPEHAVAVCLANPVAVVIIDQCLLGNADGWSVPQSIKMVKADVHVILLCHGPVPENMQPPAAVDEIVSDADVQKLLSSLEGRLPNQSAAAPGV